MYKLKSRWRFTFLVLLLWVVYCLVSLLTPQDASTSRYHISTLVIDLLIVSVSLPYLICWLYAISGWLHLQDFTRHLPAGPERNGYKNITYGLLALVASLIIPNIIRTVYLYFSHNSTGAAWNIFNNYMGIFFSFISFLLMFKGSSQLVGPIRPKITRLSRITTVLFPFVLFSIFYLLMVFTNPTRQTSPDPSLPATYYLPDSMIISTIILPVIVTWLLGLLLVLNLEHYSHFSKTINRQALVNFYNGIIIIVATTILLQALASLGSNRFAHASLGLILAIIYVLLGILTLGFSLIAHGAKKLRPLNSYAKSG